MSANGSESLTKDVARVLGDLSVAEVRRRIEGVAAAAMPASRPVSLDVLSPALNDAALAGPLRERIARIAEGYANAIAPGRRAARLAALRAELARRNLDGFLVPLSDEHQGEYVSWRAMRLAWLTGFSGSAGQAIVLKDAAALFVDGRYTLQARAQVEGDLLTSRHITDEPASDWLAEKLKRGSRLGYDPWLHTERQVELLKKVCDEAGAALVAVSSNPVDRVWRDQPPPPLGLTVKQPDENAGESAAEKRGRIAADLRRRGLDVAVITAPDSIAWLLNIRGGDVAHTPVPLSFATLDAQGRVDLFIDKRKLAAGLREHLGPEVRLHEPGAFAAHLLSLKGLRVLIDTAQAPVLAVRKLKSAKATILRDADPCIAAKARKNAAELRGMREAHLRDGAALTRFLAWLDSQAPSGTIDEMAAARVLEGFRAEHPLYRDLSFATISGAGPNGAIVHYRVTAASNRKLAPGSLYLVDSGAQYVDGTTDVTRTVAIGSAGAEERDRFTRVLKGHIALARCRFPKGTTGSQLDALARAPLWEAGLDYDHGTGHGVGSYLSVHEGPQRISKIGNTVALEPGMVLSNEPGYYKTGAFGIRIENLVAVAALGETAGGERPMFGFETLTLAPIDRTLIDASLLDAREVAWLDAYHARVRIALTPLVDADTARWLQGATQPIGAA